MEVGRPAPSVGGNFPILALVAHVLQVRAGRGATAGTCSGEECAAPLVGSHASDGPGSPYLGEGQKLENGDAGHDGLKAARRSRRRRRESRQRRPAHQWPAAASPQGAGPIRTSGSHYTATSDLPGADDLESARPEVRSSAAAPPPIRLRPALTRPPRAKAPVRVMTVKLALTPATFAALGILGFMAMFGCFHLYSLSLRYRCACKLCTGAFEVVRSLRCARARVRSADGAGAALTLTRASCSEGGFGDVLVVRRKEDGAEYVLKKIRVASVNEASDAQQEAKQLRGFRHPNIVRYVNDWLHTERGDGGAAPVLSQPKLFVCIVMERCATDFRQLVRALLPLPNWCLGRDTETPQIDDAAEAGAHLDERRVCDYFAQMCSALRYCHVRNLAHRGACIDGHPSPNAPPAQCVPIHAPLWCAPVVLPLWERSLTGSRAPASTRPGARHQAAKHLSRVGRGRASRGLWPVPPPARRHGHLQR